jgi:hypothetical protein
MEADAIALERTVIRLHESTENLAADGLTGYIPAH